MHFIFVRVNMLMMKCEFAPSGVQSPSLFRYLAWMNYVDSLPGLTLSILGSLIWAKLLTLLERLVRMMRRTPLRLRLLVAAVKLLQLLCEA